MSYVALGFLVALFYTLSAVFQPIAGLLRWKSADSV